MKTPILTLAVALVLGAAAGCDRTTEQAGAGASAPAQSSQSNTPTTPANIGQPATQAERREGASPVQQQVDPKEPEQRRDFKTPGG